MKTTKFEYLNLSKEIQHAISDMGFEEATPIQSEAIPVLLKGKDVIGQAQTGTGKTASFGIPIVEMIDSHLKNVQALVLCPTRELAIQVSEEIRELLKYKKNIHIVPIYGGQSIDRQIKALRLGVQIVIGTPGRVIDHINRGNLILDKIKIVVLDEADEMLDMGFRDDIERILKSVPKERQTIMFSATMPKQILDLSKKYLNHPEHIKVIHKELTVPKVNQYYIELKQNMKLEVLSRLIDINNPKLSLVFCNTKRGVDDLVSHLQARGYFAEGLHGDMKQQGRDKVMSKFRKGKLELLIATDVAARGIDVDDIDVVFNYDMPQDDEYYVHRIGRTARAGRTGQAFTFVVGREIRSIKEIERYTKTKIIRQQVPSLKDVEEVRTNILIEQIKESIDKGDDLKRYSSIIEKLISEDYTSFDIASGLLKLIMNDEKNNDTASDFEEFKGNQRTNGDENMTRLFINIGKSQNVKPGDFVGAIAGEAGIPGNAIGSIDIYTNFSFVNVPEKYAERVIKKMNKNKIKGKKIAVQIANEK